MNDDFFSSFRQSPRIEFNQALYTKLTQHEETATISRHLIAKRMAFALAAVCLIFVLTLAVSPPLRAAALAAIDEIITKITVRGVTVFVSDEPAPVVPTGVSESYSVLWKPVGPEDISRNYSFFDKRPDWVPSGYVLEERAALYYPSIYGPPVSAVFQWKNDAGRMIQLEVNEGSCPNGPFYESGVLRSDCRIMTNISVGLENEPQVTAVNDQPAVFFRSFVGFAELSDPVREWNPSRWKIIEGSTQSMWLIWENDGRTFVLNAGSPTVTKDDLIRMSESIPE